MQKELSNFGDHAEVTMQANASIPEGMGVHGYYHVECRDADGNLKWNEEFPNLVVAVGKQLMLDTLLRTSGTYTTVGPFLGLINNSTTYAAADTMTSKTWTELTTYTVGGSAVRGTAVFAASSSSGTTAISSSCTVPLTGYLFATRSIPSVITHLATPCVTLFVILPAYSLIESSPYVHCALPLSSLVRLRSGYSRLMPEGRMICPFLKVKHL